MRCKRVLVKIKMEIISITHNLPLVISYLLPSPMSDRDSLKRPHDEQDLTRSLKQRTYETSISRSQYERKLLAFETTRREYEITMREKNVQHAKLMKDLGWYKEKAEAEQREKDAALASLSEKKVGCRMAVE